jgi:hypothetical protein
MLKCVAIKPLGPILLRRIGEEVRADRMRQPAGHTARQILERRGSRLTEVEFESCVPMACLPAALDTRFRRHR